LTSVRRPAAERFFPLHVLSFAETLLIHGWKSTRLSLFMDKGSPRYLRGKEVLKAGRPDRTSERLMLLHWIGTTVDLWKFVFRPVVSPKSSRILASIDTSPFMGVTNMTASSANIDMRRSGERPRSLVSIPNSVATSRSLCRGSIAMTKRRGARGSSCLRPRPCQIGGFGTPLRMTLEVEDILPTYRIKGFCYVQFEQECWGLVCMKTTCRSTHCQEVIMYAPVLDEGALTSGDDRVHMGLKS
jgi:hypothetical protein